MPVINFSEPLTTLLALVLFTLVLFLGKNIKKAWVMGLLLFVFLGILVAHTVEITAFAQSSANIYKALTTSSMVDLVFTLLCFVSYLWIDHIEGQEGKKKLIVDGLDWFWTKV